MYERDVVRMQTFTGMTAEEIKSIKASAQIIAGDKDVVTPEHTTEMQRLMKTQGLPFYLVTMAIL